MQHGSGGLIRPIARMHGSTSPAPKGAHRKAGAFLAAMLMHLDNEECRRLYHNLVKAEQQDKSICRAVFLMVVLLMLCLAGLGYCALLLPDVYGSPRHPLGASLLILGLGSLISQAGFLGYLLWHRTGVGQLHRECRRLILALAQPQIEALATPVAQGLPCVETETPTGEPPFARARPAGQMTGNGI